MAGEHAHVPILLAGCLLAVLLAAAGCLAPSYGHEQNATTVEARPGDTVRVSLDETPSTGFVWNVTLSGDLAIAKTGFGSLGDLSGVPGGDSGTRTWTLTVGTAPVQKFSAVKMRPHGTLVVDEFEMTFVTGSEGR